MAQKIFDDLMVLSRPRNSSTGCAECCLRADGEKCVRVSIAQPDLQRSVLRQITQDEPVRLSRNRLEIFFPWFEGQTMEEWIYYQKPGLGQRRDRCMCLLEQMLTQKLPPTLTALAARRENLRFLPDSARLLMLPDLADWGMETEDRESEGVAVQMISSLMAEILTDQFAYDFGQKSPPELTLFLNRCEAGSYHGWEQLHSDLARIPDQPIIQETLWTRLKRRLNPAKYLPVLQRIAAVVLVILALISIFFAGMDWYERNQAGDWPGITVIGPEKLE